MGGLGQLARRHGPAGEEDVEAPPVCPIQARELGNRRVEQLLVDLPAPNLSVEVGQRQFSLIS